MTLLEKFTSDVKEAMKSGDVLVRDTLRMTIASIRNKSIELNKELTDADVVSIVKSDLKKLKDSLESFVTNAREDLAEKARKEISILEKYLPAQMTDGELEKKVRAKIEELGVKVHTEAGKVIGALAKELKDQVDGSRIKAWVEKILPKE